MQEKPIQEVIPRRTVRLAAESDVEPSNAICKAVHGHNRNGELIDSIRQASAKVILHADRITGYTGGMAFFNRSVGLANDDLMALNGSADSYGGPCILIPSRTLSCFNGVLTKGLSWFSNLS